MYTLGRMETFINKFLGGGVSKTITSSGKQ